MTLIREDIVLFHSSKQLPRLGLRHLKGFFRVDRAPFKGPHPCLVARPVFSLGLLLNRTWFVDKKVVQ